MDVLEFSTNKIESLLNHSGEVVEFLKAQELLINEKLLNIDVFETVNIDVLNSRRDALIKKIEEKCFEISLQVLFLLIVRIIYRL